MYYRHLSSTSRIQMFSFMTLKITAPCPLITRNFSRAKAFNFSVPAPCCPLPPGEKLPHVFLIIFEKTFFAFLETGRCIIYTGQLMTRIEDVDFFWKPMTPGSCLIEKFTVSGAVIYLAELFA